MSPRPVRSVTGEIGGGGEIGDGGEIVKPETGTASVFGRSGDRGREAPEQRIFTATTRTRAGAERKVGGKSGGEVGDKESRRKVGDRLRLLGIGGGIGSSSRTTNLHRPTLTRPGPKSRRQSSRRFESGLGPSDQGRHEHLPRQSPRPGGDKHSCLSPSTGKTSSPLVSPEAQDHRDPGSPIREPQDRSPATFTRLELILGRFVRAGIPSTRKLPTGRTTAKPVVRGPGAGPKTGRQAVGPLSTSANGNGSRSTPPRPPKIHHISPKNKSPDSSTTYRIPPPPLPQPQRIL